MVEGVRARGIGGLAPLARDSTRTAAGQFLVDDAATPLNQNAGVSSAADIGMASMLALQGVDEAVERDRAAHRRGIALIAALAKLQRAMLAESDPSSALGALAELASDGPLADDPGLGAILRQVILRSRIEVARRESRGRRERG